jgi:hypothetical protein
MPPDTTRLLAELYLERLTGADACAWAVSALEAGFDSENLRILAGMASDRPPTFFEVRPYLEKALREIHVSSPSDGGTILRTYARSLAEDLVSRVGSEDILNAIHGAVVSPLNHPHDLMGWCYLWEGFAADGSFAELAADQLESAAREFAERWLNQPGETAKSHALDAHKEARK